MSRRLRRGFPSLPVRRRVHGTALWMPWAHQLPDYVASHPLYGRNLVELAILVSDRETSKFAVVDVGANIGDSAALVLEAVSAQVLCIDADPHYLPYLRWNLRKYREVRVERALLLPDNTTDHSLRPERSGGTTRFVGGNEPGRHPSRTPSELAEWHRDLAPVRLVKSDTDGFDVALVPALADAWRDSHPVMFFEYDPCLTRERGDVPEVVWRELAARGYSTLAAWDNLGHFVGSFETEDWAHHLSTPPTNGYWDVAVFHDLEKTTPSQLRGRFA